MENLYQSLTIEELSAFLGGSIYSSIGQGVGYVARTVYDFGNGLIDGFSGR